jgi:UPF0755 protein
MSSLLIERKPNKKRVRSFFILIIILTFICTVVIWRSYRFSLMAIDRTSDQKVVFNVEKGKNSLQVAENLKKEQLIKSSNIFRIYMRLNNLDNKIQAGSYELSQSMTVPEIANVLISGKTVTKTFTIPEGYNLKQITKLLTEKGIVNEVSFQQALEKKYDYPFLQLLKVDKQYLEGYLFPDTYRINESMSEEEIIRMMLNHFNETVYEPYNEQIIQKGMSWHKVITIASIVEREGKVKEELPLIAGVFYNRVNKGWKLESCATVQYLLPEPKEVLTFKDLEISSPYNTYLNPGLPPGPIAAPGIAAIKAAIEPTETEYMFFVANNDGTHNFSKTFSEHLSAKNRGAK